MSHTRRHPSRTNGYHAPRTAPFDGIVWQANCAFLYGELEQSFLGVLGQEGLLDRWVASFNYYDSYFVIEERDSFVERLGIDPVQFIKYR